LGAEPDFFCSATHNAGLPKRANITVYFPILEVCGTLANTVEGIVNSAKTGYQNLALAWSQNSLGSAELFWPEKLEDVISIIKLPCDPWQGAGCAAGHVLTVWAALLTPAFGAGLWNGAAVAALPPKHLVASASCCK
jgi:hypothetical protein